MSIVLNEKKQAESIIEKGDLGKKPASTLFLLAKYYSQIEHLTKEEIFVMLNDFMQKHYKNYHPALWENTMEDISKKASKYPLREIDSVGITENELKKIAELQNIKYEKLLFTMLCYAKLYNMISETNNGWVNTDIPEIYRVAKVTVKYRNDKFLYLNDLESTGLLCFSIKNDNMNLKINFIEMTGQPALEISDFRELGYEYLKYKGEGSFINCVCCNRLVKKKKKHDYSTKYCKDCSKKIFNEQCKQSMRKRRSMNRL